MSNLDGFWAVIDAQIEELTTAKNADDVIRILATAKNPYGDPTISSSPAFFAGSGGDASVYGALSRAGWTCTWLEADYHYIMQAPDGSRITYVEGDIYRTETRR